MNFAIDESLPMSVTIHKEWNVYAKKDLSKQELLTVIAGEGNCMMLSNDDSPKFKELRNQLEAEGYIKCERNWWNGDCVIKPFTLNDVIFKVQDDFCCGAAMPYHLKSQRHE